MSVCVRDSRLKFRLVSCREWCNFVCNVIDVMCGLEGWNTHPLRPMLVHISTTDSSSYPLLFVQTTTATTTVTNLPHPYVTQITSSFKNFSSAKLGHRFHLPHFRKKSAPSTPK